MEVHMPIQAKVQLNQEDYEFIKESYRDLNYKSLSSYIRDAIGLKVREDRKKLRGSRRDQAMEMIGKTTYENIFQSLEGEDFEAR